jgi:ADP-L-glycero-D-manno-heptose 6-epimerase
MVIVTGALGFIGSMLVKELASKGINVVAAVDMVELSSRSDLLSPLSYLKYLDKDQLWDFLNTFASKNKVEWFFHIGANSSTTETDKKKIWSQNPDYSRRVFDWCSENEVPLIYASSAATYGAGELGYSDELDSEQLKPLNLYGESKLYFDQWVLRQCKAPPFWYGLKYFNVYGPNEHYKKDMSSLVFKSYFQVRDSGKIKLFKSYKSEYQDGQQQRDFVYVKDVCRWMIELMEKKPKSGIYNMGFGEAKSWNELARSVFKAMGKIETIEYVDMPESIRNQYQYFTQADMTKWRNAGLSSPKWSLEAGIKDYVETFLSVKKWET